MTNGNRSRRHRIVVKSGSLADSSGSQFMHKSASFVMAKKIIAKFLPNQTMQARRITSLTAFPVFPAPLCYAGCNNKISWSIVHGFSGL